MGKEKRYKIQNRWLIDTKNNNKELYAIDSYIDEPIIDLLNSQDQQIADLQDKLADSEKQIEDAKEARNIAVDSWCKNRRKYEAQIAEMQNKSFILYSMLYEILEKQGCENVASQIDQMTGWTYDKEADWLKGNRNYDQLKQQLAEKDREIADLQHQLKVSEKATKLACNEIDCEYMYGVYCSEYPQYFKEQAEEELKGEE